MAAFKPIYIALDLEFNQPSERIIQIGMCAGDLETGEMFSSFSQYVNPGEAIAPRIAELCGVDQGTLDAAPPLAVAFEAARAWVGAFGERRQLNPLTWGGGDSESLRQQLGSDFERWPFGRRFVDAKTVFTAYQNARGQNHFGGLRSSLKKVGLRFEGRAHDARDDAINTWRIYVRLLELFRQGLATQQP